MTNFTYQTINSKKLETYEWDNTWFELAPNTELPRVLYIGDSISCGTRRLATEAADTKILFDGFATSKALDNPYLKDSVKLFALQQPHREVILLNNGLHGFHLDDDNEYPFYYEKMVNFLLEEFPESQLIILLTTYVEKDNERVMKRNHHAQVIAKKYNLPVIDFYTLSKNMPELYFEDGVHFLDDGYKKLAEYLVKAIKKNNSEYRN